MVSPGGALARVAPDSLKQVLLNLGLNAREAMGTRGPWRSWSPAGDGEGDGGGPGPGSRGFPRRSSRGSSIPSSLPKPRSTGWGWDYSPLRPSSGPMAVGSRPPIARMARGPGSPSSSPGSTRRKEGRGGRPCLIPSSRFRAESSWWTTTGLFGCPPPPCSGMEGYPVVEAADGQEAVEALKGGGFDLILLDLRMPGLDGIQIVEVLRRWGRASPSS